MMKVILPTLSGEPLQSQPGLVKFWEISADFRSECERRKAAGRRVTPDLPLRLAEAAYSHGLDYARFCSVTGLGINAAKSATRRMGIDLETPPHLRTEANLTNPKSNGFNLGKEIAMETKKTRTARSKIKEDVALAVEMLAANGNLPAPEEVQNLTGYSKATVNRYYPARSEASARNPIPPLAVDDANGLPGSNEFVIRIGWPEGKLLPSKVTILFG